MKVIDFVCAIEGNSLETFIIKNNNSLYNYLFHLVKNLFLKSKLSVFFNALRPL